MRGRARRRRPQLHDEVHGAELDEAARFRLSLFRASGGLLYHWRALREGRRWRGFRQAIAGWLDEWHPPAARLILIGPSGGHTLPSSWLRRFTRVVAYDLDPLAPLFFRVRHRGTRVTFHREDVFWREGRLTTDSLRRILRAQPDAAILFTNVIGQLLLENEASEEEWETFLRDLRACLGNRTWASYHDRLTREGDEAIDHLTAGAWTEGLSKREFEWPLTPRSLHLIEAVQQLGVGPVSETSSPVASRAELT